MSGTMKIVVVGLGLIGGSIAKALKLYSSHEVLGMDTNEEALLDACSCGAIDRKAGSDDLRTADLVYLCVYPTSALQFAESCGPLLKEGCILTDTCGIKGEICTEMKRLQGSGHYTFVAGHPMAGKEKSGFSASEASLFSGASYLIAPCGAPQQAVETVSELARLMGFAKIVLTTPEQHDRVIAFTSQLPHVLACSYVMSPRCLEHKGFSAGSYRDVSRVADINGELWASLFLENRTSLLEEIDELQKNLSLFRAALGEENEEELRALLDTAAQIKRTEG